jgi:hypothetical protein
MSVNTVSGEGLRAAMVDQLVADHADKGLTMRPEVEAALRAVPRHLCRTVSSSPCTSLAIAGTGVPLADAMMINALARRLGEGLGGGLDLVPGVGDVGQRGLG